MAISKIKTGSITDSAVNTDKLAPGSVGSTDLSATVISGQTELSETAADTDFTIIYDTSAGTLKKVLRSNLKQAGPTISSISPTNATDAEATATFTITGTGFTAGSNARFIDTNGKITEFDTVTRDSTTQITATISTSSLSILNDPYDVQVTNGEGIASILTSQVNFNASPVFVTASGSLGSIDDNARTGISLSVNATDPDSAGNVTFEIQSGSLPAGLTLTNTAAEGGTAIISGTADAVGSDTTSNFVLRAVDAASNTSSRAFSITITAPTVQVFTASGTFAVPAGVSSVDILVVAGGGSGATTVNCGNQNGGGAGGGGAGGLIYMPSYPVTASGTLTITVGNGGIHPNSGSANGVIGQDSVVGSPGDPGLGSGGVLTAKGGGGGGRGVQNGGCAGQTGGSGGGGGTNISSQSSANQPTQPGNSGAYGFGNSGGTGAKGGGPYPDNNGGGGGGGAGAASANWFPAPAGTNAPSHAGSPGGIGRAYTIADGTTSVYYAGGGAGGGGGNNISFGGLGGGGGANPACNPGPGADCRPAIADVGSPYPSPVAEAMSGKANKGGGGAGTGDGAGPLQGCAGDGGKGVVIVRWTT